MDNDWLEQGHGSDAAHLHPVEIGAPHGAEHAPAPAAPVGRWMSKRTRSALVATTWGVVTLAATGLTVQAALFPSLGTPTGRSVWMNPGQDDEAPGADDRRSPLGSDDAPTTTGSAAPSSTEVDDHGGDPASATSIDDRGSLGHGSDDGPGTDHHGSPSTATTIDDDDDDDDATSTTVDDDDDDSGDDDDTTSTSIDHGDDDATSSTVDDDDDATSTTVDDHGSGGHGADDATSTTSTTPTSTPATSPTSTTTPTSTPAGDTTTTVDDHGGHGADG